MIGKKTPINKIDIKTPRNVIQHAAISDPEIWQMPDFFVHIVVMHKTFFGKKSNASECCAGEKIALWKNDLSQLQKNMKNWKCTSRFFRCLFSRMILTFSKIR